VQKQEGGGTKVPINKKKKKRGEPGKKEISTTNKGGGISPSTRIGRLGGEQSEPTTRPEGKKKTKIRENIYAIRRDREKEGSEVKKGGGGKKKKRVVKLLFLKGG